MLGVLLVCVYLRQRSPETEKQVKRVKEAVEARAKEGVDVEQGLLGAAVLVVVLQSYSCDTDEIKA